MLRSQLCFFSLFQTALYKSVNQEWVSADFSGTLFLYERSCDPKFGFIILNKKSTQNWIQPIVAGIETNVLPPYLLYKAPVSSQDRGSFFKRCPGRGANLGSFGFSYIFSHNCSALDHSATALPCQEWLFTCWQRLWHSGRVHAPWAITWEVEGTNPSRWWAFLFFFFFPFLPSTINR